MRVKIHQSISTKKFPMSIGRIFIFLFQDMYKKPEHERYCHYAIEYCDDHGYYWVIDSTSAGVDILPLYRWLKKYRVVKSYVYEIDMLRYEDFLSWVHKHEGKSYGFKQIPGIALRVLKFVKKNPWGAGASHIICNELVIMFLNRFVERVTGREFVDSLDLNDTAHILDEHYRLNRCNISHTS